MHTLYIPQGRYTRYSVYVLHVIDLPEKTNAFDKAQQHLAECKYNAAPVAEASSSNLHMVETLKVKVLFPLQQPARGLSNPSLCLSEVRSVSITAPYSFLNTHPH